MLYAFSFVLFTCIYFELLLFISFSNRFIFSVNAPFTREKSVFDSSFFSLKNEDFCTLTSAISSPPFQKDTTFYLYYIANVERVYTYDFLFNSSSNSSTCCNVSPFIKEKSVVSSLSSLKNHCHNLLPLQSPLHASVGMIVQFYSTLSDFVFNLCIEEKDRKRFCPYLLK